MPITFVRSAKKIAATTDAADFSACTGTGLFVAIVGYSSEGSGMSDNSTNTWASGTQFTDGGSGVSMRAYYVVNPTATAAHTFLHGGSFFSIVVFGFASVSAFDKQGGANGDAPQPGSLTPTGANDGASLFVSGYAGNIVTAAVNAPFSGTVVSNDYGAGVNYSSAAAYYIQTSPGAQNPTWSDASGTAAANLLVFSPGAAAGPPDLRVGFNPAMRLM